MNEEECLRLVEEISVLSSGIAKDALGIELKRGGQEQCPMRTVSDLPSFKAACHQLNAIHEEGTDLDEGVPSKATTEKTKDTALLKIFDQVIGDSSFIHEDKLMDVLEEVQESDSLLIKFTSLLKVIGVHNGLLPRVNVLYLSQVFEITGQRDLLSLLSVFRKVMWCKRCASSLDQCSEEEHEYVVEADDVLAALLEIREMLRKEQPSAGTQNGTEANISRLLDAREVAEFWRQFEDIFPREQEQLWTGLEYGLKQYLLVLKERESVFEECEQLRKQNSELRRLLRN